MEHRFWAVDIEDGSQPLGSTAIAGELQGRDTTLWVPWLAVATLGTQSGCA
jgi:hypothetical protein